IGKCYLNPRGHAVRMNQVKPAAAEQGPHRFSQRTGSAAKRRFDEFDVPPVLQLTGECSERFLRRPNEGKAIARTPERRVVVEAMRANASYRPAQPGQHMPILLLPTGMAGVSDHVRPSSARTIRDRATCTAITWNAPNQTQV